MAKKQKKVKASKSKKSALSYAEQRAEQAKLLETGILGKPTPDLYPNIITTFATNASKIHSNTKDILVEDLTLTYHGVELLKSAKLSLAHGQRYGLIGLNACGKTTLLRAISSRMIPIPDNIDTYTVERGIPMSDKTALEVVLEVDDEVNKLEEEADELNEKLGSGELDDSKQMEISERLSEIYERLDDLDSATAEARAGGILSGLGFSKEMQQKKTKDFSGGWRMRIALARALYLKPTFLILDEPTNHLDMEAVVWFEGYLKKWDKLLLLVSHSQDFLNGVCTNTILMRDGSLEYYGGNYDTYIRTREEKETMQQKRYDWEQEQIKNMKEYIARFGHGSAKLAKQAQSKEKTLQKMQRAGLTQKVKKDSVVSFRFKQVGKLPPPVLQLQEVTFAYPGCDNLYTKVDFGIDLDSRIALVGPNGAGKSTLLKLLTGELSSTDGMVRRHHHLKMSKFAQHFVDELPLDISPLEYMLKEFPKDEEGKVYSKEKMRSNIGRFGITGKVQTMKIGQLSDGQVSRLAFAKIYLEKPHLLLLDEPTNHLDIESIDSLAKGINEWDGGMVLVSHDMRLIGQVAKEIWICDKGTLTRWEGSILDFKKELEKEGAGKKLGGDGSKKKKVDGNSNAAVESVSSGSVISSVTKGVKELKVNGKVFEASMKKPEVRNTRWVD
eukprot:snap_masked-scaffold_17-processed-gene-0.12-mRNA-1 protein AED:0.02 eAED:0.09 QI:0/-1/0/1/-1/1/1/0/668